MIRDLLAWGTEFLTATSPSAALDAEVLLCAALGASQVKLRTSLQEEVTAEHEKIFRDYAARRATHEPVAYILGWKEFWGLRFAVTPSVLIPRPETEHLVEAVLARLRGRQEPLAIVDLGTGSGCVAIAVARELKIRQQRFSLTAVDRSPAALEVAAQNARAHGLEKDICFVLSDWLDAVSEKFDAIISNPPYVPENSSEVWPGTHFEPHGALYAGPDGMSDLRRILQVAPGHLKSYGFVSLELAGEQARPMAEFAKSQGFAQTEIVADLAGISRVLTAW